MIAKIKKLNNFSTSSRPSLHYNNLRLQKKKKFKNLKTKKNLMSLLKNHHLIYKL